MAVTITSYTKGGSPSLSQVAAASTRTYGSAPKATFTSSSGSTISVSGGVGSTVTETKPSGEQIIRSGATGEVLEVKQPTPTAQATTPQQPKTAQPIITSDYGAMSSPYQTMSIEGIPSPFQRIMSVVKPVKPSYKIPLTTQGYQPTTSSFISSRPKTQEEEIKKPETRTTISEAQKPTTKQLLAGYFGELKKEVKREPTEGKAPELFVEAKQRVLGREVIGQILPSYFKAPDTQQAAISKITEKRKQEAAYLSAEAEQLNKGITEKLGIFEAQKYGEVRGVVGSELMGKKAVGVKEGSLAAQYLRDVKKAKTEKEAEQIRQKHESLASQEYGIYETKFKDVQKKIAKFNKESETVLSQKNIQLETSKIDKNLGITPTRRFFATYVTPTLKATPQFAVESTPLGFLAGQLPSGGKEIKDVMQGIEEAPKEAGIGLAVGVPVAIGSALLFRKAITLPKRITAGAVPSIKATASEIGIVKGKGGVGIYKADKISGKVKGFGFDVGKGEFVKISKDLNIQQSKTAKALKPKGIEFKETPKPDITKPTEFRKVSIEEVIVGKTERVTTPAGGFIDVTTATAKFKETPRIGKPKTFEVRAKIADKGVSLSEKEMFYVKGKGFAEIIKAENVVDITQQPKAKITTRTLIKQESASKIGFVETIGKKGNVVSEKFFGERTQVEPVGQDLFKFKTAAFDIPKPKKGFELADFFTFVEKGKGKPQKLTEGVIKKTSELTRKAELDIEKGTFKPAMQESFDFLSVKTDFFTKTKEAKEIKTGDAFKPSKKAVDMSKLFGVRKTPKPSETISGKDKNVASYMTTEKTKTTPKSNTISVAFEELKKSMESEPTTEVLRTEKVGKGEKVKKVKDQIQEELFEQAKEARTPKQTITIVTPAYKQDKLSNQISETLRMQASKSKQEQRLIQKQRQKQEQKQMQKLDLMQEQKQQFEASKFKGIELPKPEIFGKIRVPPPLLFPSIPLKDRTLSKKYTPTKRKQKYTANFQAIFFGSTTTTKPSQTKKFTGFEIRPIIQKKGNNQKNLAKRLFG